MTTAVDPDTEQWQFQDVEIRCDITDPDPIPCEHPAAWVANWTAPCHGKHVFALVCDYHKNYLLLGGPWRCPTHARRYHPVNVTIEPL